MTISDQLEQDARFGLVLGDVGEVVEDQEDEAVEPVEGGFEGEFAAGDLELLDEIAGPRHARFECRLYDDLLVDKYNFFIFEVVKAHVAAVPKHPETLHYTGEGVFMVAGKIISRRALFRRRGARA